MEKIHPTTWQMARHFVVPEIVNRIFSRETNLSRIALLGLTSTISLGSTNAVIAEYNRSPEPIIDQIVQFEGRPRSSRAVSADQVRTHLAQVAEWAIPAFDWPSNAEEILNRTFVNGALRSDSFEEMAAKLREEYPDMNPSLSTLSSVYLNSNLDSLGFYVEQGSFLNLNSINNPTGNLVIIKGDWQEMSCVRASENPLILSRAVGIHEWGHSFEGQSSELAPDDDLFFLAKQAYDKQYGHSNLDLSVAIDGFGLKLRFSLGNDNGTLAATYFSYGSFNEFANDFIVDTKQQNAGLAYVSSYLNPFEIEKWKRILEKNGLSLEDFQRLHESNSPSRGMDLLRALKSGSGIEEEDEDTWVNLFQATFGWKDSRGDWTRLAEFFPELVDDVKYQIRYSPDEEGGCLITVAEPMEEILLNSPTQPD